MTKYVMAFQRGLLYRLPDGRIPKKSESPVATRAFHNRTLELFQGRPELLLPLSSQFSTLEPL